MPYDGRVFRILIASPSDVEEEREAAVRAIQEWNDLHSYSRKVVLLPLRWETHTAPEYGSRPQDVINRAIVDNCDLLVGIFWTRIGTPTGKADSGTLEEIDRVAKAGKQVMLYFSKAGADPDGLDLEQLQRLRGFKEKTYPNALIESYKSVIDFHDKFARQIELKIRDLQKADSAGQPPALALNFLSGKGKQLEGANKIMESEIPYVEDLDARLREFSKPGEAERVRDAVEKNIRLASAIRVRLAISNQSASGIRNLFCKITSHADGDCEVSNNLFPNQPDIIWSNLLFEYKWAGASDDNLADNDIDDDSLLEFEWDAIQPQRTKIVPKQFFVVPRNRCQITFVSQIFADSFPQPTELTSTLTIETRVKKVSLEEIIPNLKDVLEPPTGIVTTMPVRGSFRKAIKSR